MRLPAWLATAMVLLAASAGPLNAQADSPIPIARFPHVAIISPVFYWDSKVDVVRTVSATCPQGRPIAGGVSIQKGNASLRIRESFPDGSSWVIRVVNRQTLAPNQPLQIRTYAVCLLPVARGGSVLLAQYPRMLQMSHRFALPPGDVTTAERQPCAQNALVLSGGLGLDPDFKGRSFLRMELSYPDKWAWNVRAINGADAAEPAAEAHVYGICLGHEEGLNIRNYQTVSFVEATVSVKAGDGTVRQSVNCKHPSAYALAGGARIVRGHNAALEIQESFPDTPGSWTIALANRNPANAGNATVRLYATCIGR
jgi:hypothetical protein